MKTLGMTSSQKIKYYQEQLATAIAANDDMRNHNEMLAKEIARLINENQWYKGIIDAFVRYMKRVRYMKHDN